MSNADWQKLDVHGKSFMSTSLCLLGMVFLNQNWKVKYIQVVWDVIWFVAMRFSQWRWNMKYSWSNWCVGLPWKKGRKCRAQRIVRIGTSQFCYKKGRLRTNDERQLHWKIAVKPVYVFVCVCDMCGYNTCECGTQVFRLTDLRLFWQLELWSLHGTQFSSRLYAPSTAKGYIVCCLRCNARVSDL